MRFLLLIHGDEEAEAAMGADQRRAIVEQHMGFAGALREQGKLVLGDALLGSDASAVVRPGRTPFVTDGPYATTKEAVGGFYVIACASRATRRSSSPGGSRKARV
jgi:hypothetical protein